MKLNDVTDYVRESMAGKPKLAAPGSIAAGAYAIGAYLAKSKTDASFTKRVLVPRAGPNQASYFYVEDANNLAFVVAWSGNDAIVFVPAA